MDRNVKKIAVAIIGLAIICIAAIAVVYIWNIYASVSGSGGTGSLFFSYSADNGTQLYPTQYTQNGSLAGRIYVEGSSDTLLMALEDYNVTAFYYNGSFNKTHMIAKNAYINETGVVTPYDATNPKLAFNVTGIPDGFHDVELIGFVGPYNFTGADWLSDGPFTSGGIRFNVIVNNSTKPGYAYTDDHSSNGTIYSTNYTLGPDLTKDPFANKMWQKENVKGGSIIDYYVNLKSPIMDGKTMNFSFAIVQMLDYTQIPIRVGSPDTVYYGHIDNNTSAAVHLNVRAPDTMGNHKLIVIVAGDPYENLEVTPYVENGQTWTTNKNISAFTTVEHQDIVVE